MLMNWALITMADLSRLGTILKDDSYGEAALTLMTTVTKVNDTDRNQTT
jgi:hypothetical protein